MTGWVRIVYAITLIAAVTLAFFLIRRRQSRLDLSTRQRLLLALFAFVGASIGSKIPFLLEEGWDALFSGTVWFADGKTILGGIFGGYVAVELAKAISGIQVRTGDSYAIPVAVAVSMGRVGCFIAGCCYGTPTTIPWGVDFKIEGDPAVTLRHPTQIYEFLFHAFSIVALIGCDHKQWLRGNQLKAYLLAYLTFRFFTEWIRPESICLMNLTSYQLASVALASVLVVLWIWQGPDPPNALHRDVSTHLT